MALADTAALAVRLTLDDRQFTGPLRRVQTNLTRLDRGFSRAGRGVGQLGSGLLRAGTIIGASVVTGVIAATGAALKFEDAFAGVRKTVNEADLTAVGLSFETLRNAFLQMSTEIPIAATEFARLGETAGALGVKAQDIDDFAKTAALLGVTTNLSADEAADALGRIGTILAFTGKDFEHFADILVNLGNQGASTEAEIIEITKRFAGVGRMAGLTVEEIAALSSAVSSLGAEPEAGGSALSRIFSNLATEIANGTKKGKAFAQVTGDSLDELRKRIDKGDALGIFMETLEGISKMSRTEAASVLRALGITNVRDRDAILKMAQNLDEVNRQLDVAESSVGALGTEAAKRFASPLQKLITMRNAAIRLAIAFGDGVAPAVGRAADKIAALFRDQDNLDKAKEAGQSLGKAIDGIDWAKVLDGAKQFGAVLKSALDFALVIARTLNTLPTEIKAAGLGIVGLNKLSGGLVGAGLGNIVGGLAGAGATGLAAKAPGIGRLFAQPVFVTNWPVGGLGGGGRGAGGVAATGASRLGTAVRVLGTVALAAGSLMAIGELWQEREAQSAENKEAGKVLIQNTQTFAQSSQIDELRTALMGIETYQQQLASGFTPESFAYALNIDGVATKINETKAILASKIAELTATTLSSGNSDRAAIVSATTQSKNAIVSSGHSDRNAIVTAIRSSRPIVNVSVRVSGAVTRVIKNYQSGTQAYRGGPTEYD